MAACGLLLVCLVSTLLTTGAGVEENQLLTTGAGVEENQLLTTEGLIVDCSNKTLRSIPSNHPQNITKLILSNNLIELSIADEAALKNYSRLTELHLDGNRLTVLPGKLFKTMSELKVLNLSHNNISRVEPKALSGLFNLRELDLSHNQLQSLPLDLLADIQTLAILRLGGNTLRKLYISVEKNQLKELDLKENPLNCSCVFLNKIKSMTDSKVQITGSCASPEDLAGKGILDNGTSCSSGSSSSSSSTVSPPTTQSTTEPTSAQTPTHSVSLAVTEHTSLFDKGVDPGSGSGMPVVGNTWKFLLGVVAIALTTSMLIVCAVKSPSWYKLLFNYRHQRLRDEEEDANVFTTGRYSNFSLDTEHTETSAHELDHRPDGLDDEEEEDGYIEDRYIEAEDYKDNTEP